MVGFGVDVWIWEKNTTGSWVGWVLRAFCRKEVLICFVLLPKDRERCREGEDAGSLEGLETCKKSISKIGSS